MIQPHHRPSKSALDTYVLVSFTSRVGKLYVLSFANILANDMTLFEQSSSVMRIFYEDNAKYEA